MEKIVDSSTALELFDKTTDIANKLDLLLAICSQLAKQHSKGIVQKDLHLGNFLLADNKVFMLDSGQMSFFAQPITRKKALAQLAMLACYLTDNDTESITKLCKQYFKLRCWQFDKSDIAPFQKQLTVHRKRSIRKGLKKCLRTSKRHLRIKTGRYVAVFERNFCHRVVRKDSLGEPLDFAEQIDALMNEGQILKNGNTCYVSRFTWNDRDIVVKRYNHKGIIHSLRHTIRRSRARRCWLHAHRLGMINIATPKPLAYIEQHRGHVVWKSYLVTEYVQGQKLYDFLRDNHTAQQRSKTSQQLKELLKKLGRYRITHGDLKPSNILITDTGPVLTDLDAMITHKLNWIYRLKRAKDMQRFAEIL